MYPVFTIRRLNEIPHHCCDNRLDGGFMPQIFDVAPHADEDPWANKRSRMMQFGPLRRCDVGPDVVPSGGLNQHKKMFKRRDAPWTTTSKPKLFSQPPYWSPAEEAAAPEKLKASPPPTKRAPKTLAPMRAGKSAEPYSAYGHAPDLAVSQADPLFTGKNLRTGRAPDYFDMNAHEGPQMVAGPPKRDGYIPQRVGKLKTNLRKKDTFGAYPAHIADPYKDNPLGDGPCCRKGGLLVPCISRGKPNMPIVNVWDPPDGLQTKGGVRRTLHPTSGEVTFTLSEKGRLGTTI